MTILIDDDEREDVAPEGDAAPNADEPGILHCRYCPETFTGVMASAWRGRHEKKEHGDLIESLPTTPGPAKKAGAKKKPAAKRAAPRRDAAPGGTDRAELTSVRQNVELFYSVSAMMVAFVSDPVGGAIQQSTPQCVSAWVNLAKTNPKVREFWSGDSAATNWLPLFMAHVPIGYAVVGAHILPGIQRRRDRRDDRMDEYEDEDLSGQPVVYAPSVITDEDADLGLSDDGPGYVPTGRPIWQEGDEPSFVGEGPLG